MFCLSKVTKIFKIYCFFLSSLFLQDENMRRGKTKAKMKNVSDTLEHSNIFGSNIQSIKRSDLNYFTVFCLNFIMNSQIPLKSFKLCFNKITPDLKMNLFAFIFSVLFDVWCEVWNILERKLFHFRYQLFIDKEKYQTLSWNKKYCLENWK